MLIETIPYKFENEELFNKCFTHVSWVGENLGDSYEKLEFLGDAILDAFVATYLFNNFDLTEGNMAKVKAEVVSEDSLARIAIKWKLEDHIKVSKGEINAASLNGEFKNSILCDIVESTIAGIYITEGYDFTQELILPHFKEIIAEAVKSPGGKDHKSNLQEVCVSHMLSHPVYEIIASGPDHDVMFETTVIVQGFIAGKGEGPSKKKSQQAAAKNALASLDEPTLAKLQGKVIQ